MSSGGNRLRSIRELDDLSDVRDVIRADRRCVFHSCNGRVRVLEPVARQHAHARLIAVHGAFAHCRPGGVVLVAPDFVRESFQPLTDHGGSDRGGRGLRYLEWCWDPDPADSTYVVDYALMLRERDGREPSPTAAILDTQSVKTTEKGALAATTRPRGSRAASGTARSAPRACCRA